jgi:hypothetical protein
LTAPEPADSATKKLPATLATPIFLAACFAMVTLAGIKTIEPSLDE